MSRERTRPYRQSTTVLFIACCHICRRHTSTPTTHIQTVYASCTRQLPPHNEELMRVPCVLISMTERNLPLYSCCHQSFIIPSVWALGAKGTTHSRVWSHQKGCGWWCSDWLFDGRRRAQRYPWCGVASIHRTAPTAARLTQAAKQRPRVQCGKSGGKIARCGFRLAWRTRWCVFTKIVYGSWPSFVQQSGCAIEAARLALLRLQFDSSHYCVRYFYYQSVQLSFFQSEMGCRWIDYSSR